MAILTRPEGTPEIGVPLSFEHEKENCLSFETVPKVLPQECRT